MANIVLFYCIFCSLSVGIYVITCILSIECKAQFLFPGGNKFMHTFINMSSRDKFVWNYRAWNCVFLLSVGKRKHLLRLLPTNEPTTYHVIVSVKCSHSQTHSPIRIYRAFARVFYSLISLMDWKSYGIHYINLFIILFHLNN